MDENLQLLFDIDQELDSEEVASLKFLCSDVLGRKNLAAVSDARGLFIRLSEQGQMDDDMFFLQELLLTIKRFDLLKEIMGLTKQQVLSSLQMHGKRLSAYRTMLYEIADNMTNEKLVSFKFLVNLPRGKLEASATIFDVLSKMEKQHRLTKDNVEELERILNEVDKELAGKVEHYRHETSGGSWQEMENNLHPPYTFSKSIAETHEGEDYQDMSRNRGLSVVSDAGPVTNDEDERYPMGARPRGRCLIINNYRFSHDGYRDREGTMKDAVDLRRVFEWLHFVVDDQRDLSAQNMKMVVDKYAQMDHSDYDALVVCVLSHGLEGTVMGVDGLKVSIKELYKPFTRCPSLVGKPKLFFIQACQGDYYQEGLLLEDGPKEQIERFEEDAQRLLFNKTSVAVEADVLIGMATVEEFKSFRHTTTGSIYIQALCKALELGCPKNEDMLTILTRVNNEVSKGVYNNYKQMPQPKYTLTKKLVLTVD